MELSTEPILKITGFQFQKKIYLSQEEADKRYREIAVEVNGESWNDRGWPTNIGKAVEISNIKQLYKVLAINGPVYAYYSNGKNNHHLVVVTGVDVDNNIIYTNNPWGIQGEQSFNSFKKHVAKKFLDCGGGMRFIRLYLIG